MNFLNVAKTVGSFVVNTVKKSVTLLSEVTWTKAVAIAKRAYALFARASIVLTAAAIAASLVLGFAPCLPAAGGVMTLLAVLVGLWVGIEANNSYSD